MFDVAVIGPVIVERDGIRVPIRPGKDTELLVRLAVEPGRSLRVERLLDELWEGDAARRNTLQAKVSSLRRSVGDPAFVGAGAGGYSLAVGPAHVDTVRAERLSRRAEELTASGDLAGVAELSGHILELFAGEILPGAGDARWVAPYRARLDELRLHSAELHWAARLELGDSDAAIRPVQSLLGENPLRERLWVCLIKALYRTGRQADALAACRRARRALATEAGIDPGPELRSVERQVLLQEMRADGQRGAVQASLPVYSNDLVGRDEDISAVVADLAETRLLTMVGPAGVGKTRTAVEVGLIVGASLTCFVRLDTAVPGVPVIDTIGGALGVADATVPQVAERLGGRAMLLLLDNCEHLLDEVGPLVEHLLDAVPDLRILATSRAPLALPIEVVHLLRPLGLRDSVELFSRRAHRRPHSDEEQWQVHAQHLCRSLDGLPLAIELAAARTKVLSLPELSQRLADRAITLGDPDGPRPDRHRTLTAAIRWSYDLLFPDEQKGLWVLARFPRGATMDGLEDVLAELGVPRAAVVDVAVRLVDRSLVLVEEGPSGPQGSDTTTRYRLLDSVREFAADRLDESGSSAVVHRAHARRMAELADSAATGLRGGEQARHLAAARAARSDIDAALSWAAQADPALGLRIATGFGWAWMMLGDNLLGARRLRRALDTAPDAETSTRSRAWGLLGWLESARDLDAADAATEEAIRLSDGQHDRDLSGWAFVSRAFVLSQRGQPAEQLAFLSTWPNRFPDLDGTWEHGVALVLTSRAALLGGDLAGATAAAARALDVVPPLDDDWGNGHLESLLGVLAQAQGQFARAADHFTQAATSARRLGFVATEGFHLSSLGRVLHEDGQDDEAAAVLRQVVALGEACGELRVAAVARTRLARVLRSTDDDRAARGELRAACTWFTGARGGEGSSVAACLLAAIDCATGLPGALDRLRAVLDTAERDDDREVRVLAGDALARHYAGVGEWLEAESWLARSDELYPSSAHLLVERDRVDAAQVRAALSRP